MSLLLVGLFALVAFLGLVVTNLAREVERIRSERDMYRDEYYRARNERYKTIREVI